MTKPKKKRKPGRPSNAEGPAFPRVEVDRLLVHGEVVLGADGKPADVYFPTHQEIAEMFGVSRSMISLYAKRHNCARRRRIAEERLQAKVDNRVLEARAEAIALRKEDELRIIDAYLRGFEVAIEEGRVRFDSPADFNTMIRLKSFVNGGADARQEVHTTLSLDDIQARHRETLKVQQSGGVVRGEIAGSEAGMIDVEEASPLTSLPNEARHEVIEEPTAVSPAERVSHFRGESGEEEFANGQEHPKAAIDPSAASEKRGVARPSCS